jgi:hypothetical protein
MASYKEIFGTNIEVLASDPANPVAGQVWYNSTDNVVKGAALRLLELGLRVVIQTLLDMFSWIRN